MRTLLVPAAFVAAFATSMPVRPAQAAGCIKGAIAGGLAGRGIANRSACQKQVEQQNLQNGSQGYS